MRKAQEPQAQNIDRGIPQLHLNRMTWFSWVHMHYAVPRKISLEILPRDDWGHLLSISASPYWITNSICA